MKSAECVTVHATTVAFEDRAALIRGKSGSGKSSLALQLLALGGKLVSDDRTHILRRDGLLLATAPAPIRGRIEARGIGILKVPSIDQARVTLIVDMDQMETQRLPERRKDTILGLDIAVVRKSENTCFPSAIALYLSGERNE